MRGSERNTIEKICPKCGANVVIKELNDGSSSRNYDSAECPNCGEIIHEDYIVGEFVSEIRN